MAYRIKLIIALLIFPIVTIVFAIWGNFFTGSPAHYLGSIAGIVSGLHLCWGLNERWDAERLQPRTAEQPSLLARDEMLLGNGALLFGLITLFAFVVRVELSDVYGPFSFFLVVIGFGYVIARLIIQK